MVLQKLISVMVTDRTTKDVSSFIVNNFNFSLFKNNKTLTKLELDSRFQKFAV